MKMLAISGPTASGKSELALKIASRIGGEIVSVDSMQIYREFNVGVAKPSQEEQRLVRHHMLSVAGFNDRMDVYRYVEMARRAIADIEKRGNPVILCGGTGFYLKALIYGLDDLPGDEAVRLELETLGGAELAELAMELDAAAYARWHGCRRKLLRALEVKKISGCSILELQQRADKALLDVKHYTLRHERDILKRRIAARVDSMLEHGWMEETKKCLEAGLLESPTARQAIGYRLIGTFFDGAFGEAELRQKIGTATWQYARRQETWFRNQHPEALILNMSDFEDEDEVLNAITY